MQKKKNYVLQLGVIKDRVLDPPIHVPGKETAFETKDAITVAITGGLFGSAFKMLQEMAKNGHASVKIVAEMRVIIGDDPAGGFEFNASYVQKDVKVNFR